jgi:hypothetical protein
LLFGAGMNRFRTGAVLLSLWSGLNFALALAITLAIVGLGQDPPCLHVLLDERRIRALDPDVIATFRALGSLGNGCIAALCALVLIVVWVPLRAGARWAWRALAFVLVPVQGLGFASDQYFGHRDWPLNVVSTVVLVAGLAFTRARASRRLD